MQFRCAGSRLRMIILYIHTRARARGKVEKRRMREFLANPASAPRIGNCFYSGLVLHFNGAFFYTGMYIYMYTRMIFHGWCMSVSLLYGVYQRLNKKIMKCICHGNDIRYMYSNATCTYHSGFLIITRYSYRILLYNCNEIFHFKATENN